MSVCLKKGKRILLAGIFAGGVMAIGAAPAPATTLDPKITVDERDQRVAVSNNMRKECKTVTVLANASANVGVTVGRKRTPIPVDPFRAYAEVKVCVEVDVNASVDISPDVIIDEDNLCVSVEVLVRVRGSVEGSGISVEVVGLDKDGKPLTVSTGELDVNPIGSDGDVELFLEVCDP